MITRYVNTASTAGGDGTTNGTVGSTRAFASLREALDSLPGTLTDAVTINCSGTAADTLNTAQAHWDFVTSATNYIVVQGDNTTGKWNTSAYRMEVGNEAGIYNNNPSHVRLHRLQVKLTVTSGGTGTGYVCFRLATANNASSVDHRISSCIAWVNEVSGTDPAKGYENSDPTVGGTCRIWNSIAYGGRAGFASDGTTWARDNLINYNCTSYDNESNYIDLQTCINCIGASHTGAGDFVSTGTTAHSNNAATDASAGGTNARDNQTFSFVDPSNGDFHLQAGDTGAKGFGLTDPASGLFSDDIDGQTRSGAWDIGADQYVAGVVVPAPRHRKYLHLLGR